MGRKGILLAIALTALLAAGCGSKRSLLRRLEAETSAPAETATEPEAGNQELPNPMVEVGCPGLEAIGVHMVLPEGLRIPAFHHQPGGGDAQFTLDGVAYTYRASDTAEDFAEFSSDLRMRPLHRTMITVKPA